MSKYNVVNKTYVKTNNKTSLIINRYFYSLIGFTILSVLLYLIFKKNDLVIALLKSIALSFGFSVILGYLINLIFKDYSFINLFKKDNIHIMALILGSLSPNVNIIILGIAVLVTLIVKKLIKGINLSAVLYGLLVILGYKYFTGDIILLEDIIDNELTKDMIINYLIGVNSLNPILALGTFIYLFYKKSIKYNAFIYYLLVVFIVMLGYGIINDMNIVFPFIVLASNNLIFLSVYTLTDYGVTPTINETQMIYGIVLGIFTCILTFILPMFSVVIPLIIGPLLLTKYLDKISYKIKYRKD